MACYYTQSCGKSLKGFVQKHQNDQIRELERWAGSLWGADCRRVGTPWEQSGDSSHLAVEMKVAWTEVDQGGLGLRPAKLETKLKLDRISDSSWWYFHVNTDHGKACEMAVLDLHWCFTSLIQGLMKMTKLIHTGSQGEEGGEIALGI